MLKQYSYRKKVYLLLSLSVVFLFLCYNLALKPTLNLIHENQAVEEGLLALDTIPARIAETKQRLAAYDDRVKTSYAEKSVQSFVLEYVVDYCGRNGIVIKEYPQPFNKVDNDYVLETNRLILTGNFSKILSLVYIIEQKYHVGKVSSLRFYKNRNSGSNSIELLTDMYIQTIKANNPKGD